MENAFGQPQIVVVLGGTSDIARALTKRLCAARAHTVVLAGTQPSPARRGVRGGRRLRRAHVDTVVFDAEDPADAERAVTECFEKVDGPVDLVVVAVGLTGRPIRRRRTTPRWRREMANVNFAWPVAALAEIRRRLVDQGSGRILVISSVAAVRVRRQLYLYGGAKAGLDRLCQGMADSLEGTGVRLQFLRPGVVRTRMARDCRTSPSPLTSTRSPTTS